jgi:NDP-sugar pyrophosphorylase family protein
MDEEKLNRLREVTASGGKVTPHVSLSKSAILYAPAEAYDNTEILGKAEVSGDSKLRDYAKVAGEARVVDSKLFTHARVLGRARVERSQISGTAEIMDRAYVSGSLINGNAVIADDAEVIGCRIGCNARILGSARLYNVRFVPEDAESTLSDRILVEGSAELDFDQEMPLYPGTRLHEGYWTRPPFVIDTPVFTMTEGINDRVQIGCQNHSIKFWYEKGREVLLDYGLDAELYQIFIRALDVMVEHKKENKSPTKRRRKRK